MTILTSKELNVALGHAMSAAAGSLQEGQEIHFAVFVMAEGPNKGIQLQFASTMPDTALIPLLLGTLSEPAQNRGTINQEGEFSDYDTPESQAAKQVN